MSPEEELLRSITNGEKARVEQLLAQGASVDAVDGDGHSVLHYAAGVTGPACVDIAAILIDHGADVNATMKWGKRPLHSAANSGNAPVASLLIAKGADVNAQARDRQTPLHMAVEQGQKDVVQLLLAKGGNAHVRDSTGSTPLRIAERKGDTEIAALLNAHGEAGPPRGTEGARHAAAEEGRRVGTAKPPEQIVSDVMALVKRHRSNDGDLESALANYFGVRAQSRTTHPRVNPAGGTTGIEGPGPPS